MTDYAYNSVPSIVATFLKYFPHLILLFVLSSSSLYFEPPLSLSCLFVILISSRSLDSSSLKCKLHSLSPLFSSLQIHVHCLCVFLFVTVCVFFVSASSSFSSSYHLHLTILYAAACISCFYPASYLLLSGRISLSLALN